MKHILFSLIVCHLSLFSMHDTKFTVINDQDQEITVAYKPSFSGMRSEDCCASCIILPKHTRQLPHCPTPLDVTVKIYGFDSVGIWIQNMHIPLVVSLGDNDKVLFKQNERELAVADSVITPRSRQRHITENREREYDDFLVKSKKKKRKLNNQCCCVQ